MVHLSCLINVLFDLILMENSVVFSNARSIWELMLCNCNLTKFDIITLWSSDCRAWALKLRDHLKNNKICFCLHFANSNFIRPLLHFLLNFLKIMSRLQSINQYNFFLNINGCHKSGKESNLKKRLPPLETNWTLLFFSFFTRTTPSQSRTTK